MYLDESLLDVQLLGRGFASLDTGTMDSLAEATNFVQMIQNRQGIEISAPEEIAFINGWIDRTPTYTLDLSRLLVDMTETEKYGYYHATNEGGYISWYDFTVEIYKQAGIPTKVTPVTTAEYGLSKAARPFNSRLDKSKLIENGFTPLPTWQNALSRYLTAII